MMHTKQVRVNPMTVLTLAGWMAACGVAHAQQAGAAATNSVAKPTASVAAAQPKPAPAAHEPEAAPSNGATHQNVKVHGHWKITVHDPDGKFVKEVEFENSLVTPNSADVILSQMLAGQFALAGFSIDVNGGLCTYYYGNLPSDCYLVPGTGNFTVTNTIQANNCYYNAPVSQYCYAGLTQTYVPYNATTKAAAYFQLTGSLTALNSGSISTVATVLNGCEVPNSTGPSTISNATCFQSYSTTTANSLPGPTGSNYFNFITFTSYTLPNSLSITAGQVVTVVVAISFS